MEEKSKTWFSKQYNRICRILLTPFFYSIGRVFSHGATHFTFFFIVLFGTLYLWEKNNREDIRTHNVALDVGWTNPYYEQKGLGVFKDSIKNLKIHFELNSKDAENRTDGKYHNRILLEFDGEGPLKRNNLKYGDSYLAATPARYDSIRIALFGDPIISNISFAIESDSFIKYDTIPKPIYIEKVDSSFIKWMKEKFPQSETNPNDSNSLFIEGEPEILVDDRNPGTYIENPDTTRYLHFWEDQGSTFVLKLIPKQYNFNNELRSPCQRVYIYSDALGVQKNDPYYYYYINFPSEKISGNLVLDFKVSDLAESTSDFNYVREINLQYNYVYPEPDVINNGYIKYCTKEKMAQIVKNHGIVIQAIDTNALNESNNHAFLYSVLVGTGLAFLIDIIIQLIKEIRNFNRRFGNRSAHRGSDPL